MRLRNAKATTDSPKAADNADKASPRAKGKRKDKKSEASPEKKPPQEEEDESEGEEGDDCLGFVISTRPEGQESDGDEEGEDVDGDEEDDDSDDGEEVEKENEGSEEEESDEEVEEEKDEDWSRPLGRQQEEDDEVEVRSGVLGSSRKVTDKERMLQRMLFGAVGGDDVAEIKDDSDEEDEGAKEEEEAEDAVTEEVEPKDDLAKKKKKKKKSKEARKPAWVDEEDQSVTVKDVTATYSKARGKHGAKETSTESYSRALKRKYVAIVGTPAWAELDGGKRRAREEEDDSDEEFFRETTDMLDSGKHEELTKGSLSYRKVPDLNCESRVQGAVIRAAEFHPSKPIALVAGLSGTASLFQVGGRDRRTAGAGGEHNAKIQTVHFADFPVKTAHFARDGAEFVCGSHRAAHFQVFDLGSGVARRVETAKSLQLYKLAHFEVSPCGKYLAVLGRFGQVHLLSARTKDHLHTFQRSDDVQCAAFSPDGQQLYTHGAGGEVFVFDVRDHRSCVRRFADAGVVTGTALAASPDGRHLATGDAAGVVNLYDARDVSDNPRPLKEIKNLTTQIHRLKFNPTSEILALSSEGRDGAVRLCHVPSRSVFANFPSPRPNLRVVNCLDFSLNGGYMSVGNNAGAAHLYRLDHFGGF